VGVDFPQSDVVILLLLVAFVAGYVDAIAGGGGLLTVPALLLAGLPPAEAIATNKLQGTFGVASSSFAFWRAGHVDLRAMGPPIAAAAAGAVLGSALVAAIDPGWLKPVIPVVLIAIAVYFALSPNLDQPRKAGAQYGAAMPALIAAAVGFYDGVVGPGAGSFYLMGLVAVLGRGLMQATAQTKVLNLTSNLAALTVFLIAGKVDFAIGLTMALGQVAGGWLGAHSALRFGSPLIRPMVATVSALIAVRLLFENFAPT
jgi:uncharacterized protein